MIYGIGCDIIEVSRIKKVLSKDIGFKEKVFTKAEILLCESKGNSFQSYAARFAAKEALMKALQTGWAEGVSFQEIEVLNLDSGAPIMNLFGKTKAYSDRQNITSIKVSLSHLKEMAMAMVSLETD